MGFSKQLSVKEKDPEEETVRSPSCCGRTKHSLQSKSKEMIRLAKKVFKKGVDRKMHLSSTNWILRFAENMMEDRKIITQLSTAGEDCEFKI